MIPSCCARQHPDGTRARKVFKKASFGKLFVKVDERRLYVASDELNEPFETVCTPGANRALAKPWSSKNVPAGEFR